MSTLTPSPSAPSRAPSAQRLRQFLALDAVVTGVNGLAYLLVAGPLATLLAVPADVLRPIGVFLIVFSLAVGCVAGRGSPPRVATRAIIVANFGWVAVSLLALTIGALSPSLVGGLWIVAQAAVVGAFAVAQTWALHQLH